MNDEREKILELLNHELKAWRATNERAANFITSTLAELIDIIKNGKHLTEKPEVLRP